VDAKEVVAGFYVIEAPDLEAALAIARTNPAIRDGGDRRATRVDTAERLVRLADQDRSAWDRVALAEADAMIVGCLRAGPPGRYVLQAAIASLYADRLLGVWPSPVVALNRTVPLAMVSGPGMALAEVERLERDERLAGYNYPPAINERAFLEEQIRGGAL
jgi:predicted RNA polymerase sigma factor